MNKIVVYTCLVGGYDNLPQYEVLDSRFDYICFSNDFPPYSKQGQWEIRPIPYQCKDKTRLSRYPKLLPHIVLPEYEYSIWLDSNISVISPKFYVRIAELCKSNQIMASVMHPTHRCIYSDAYQCIKDGRDYARTIINQIKHLKQEGYPSNNGLYENNLIFRKHNDSLIQMISNEWWDEYLQYSKRDQLSLCYILWKFEFKPTHFFSKGISTSNSEMVQRIQHTRAIGIRFKTLIRRISNRISLLRYK